MINEKKLMAFLTDECKSMLDVAQKASNEEDIALISAELGKHILMLKIVMEFKLVDEKAMGIYKMAKELEEATLEILKSS